MRRGEGKREGVPEGLPAPKGHLQLSQDPPGISPAAFFPPPQAGTCSRTMVLLYKLFTDQRDKWELCSPSHIPAMGPSQPRVWASGDPG